jgi:hypothetical protein
MRIMICVNHRFWQRGVELCALVGAWETATRADQAVMSLTTVPCTSVKRKSRPAGNESGTQKPERDEFRNTL